MKKASILIIDDEPDNFDVIETFLSDQDYDLHYVNSGSKAISSLSIVQPDLILLDMMMQEMDGLEVCKRIKAIPQWQAVPIIMVTALASRETMAECLEMGADDFISKPVNRIELIARVRSMLRIHQQYQELSTFNAQLETLVHIRTEELQKLIFADALTGLPSRTLLLQELSKALDSKSVNVTIAYLDCDDFKLVNGSFGYKVGNQLLQAIAQRLKKQLRSDDLLARVGDDEFCFLLYNLHDNNTLTAWIQGVFRQFETSFKIDNYEIFMSFCMGIAWKSHDHKQPEEILQAADTAMYKAKLLGKGSYQVFDHQMYLAILHRLTLENELKHALEHEEFVNYYQSIVKLDTQQIVGFEALVRWQHPERGIVFPGEFIASMEETGQIIKLGLIVLRKACQQLHAWHQQGWLALTMSVNLSVRNFNNPSLLSDIDQVIQETGVNPAYLKLEITESAIMHNPEEAIALMEELRSRQIQFSIDDFGTGYCSLGYLHRFPLNILKIDRSFVIQIQEGNRNYQVVKTIITLSNQLDISVVAEGIETTDELQWLQQLDCEFGQGYLFSKPIPAHQVTTELLKIPTDG